MVHTRQLEAARTTRLSWQMWRMVRNLFRIDIYNQSLIIRCVRSRPGYEQGLCFLWTSGWEIYTRARQGDPDGAFELYRKLLGGKASNYSRFRTTRFWQQNAGWGVHESRQPGGGSDVLLDQIVTVWGFLRGCFGIEPTLTGLEVVHRPAKQLEGSTWSFVHLGKRRSAKVLNGKVVLE